MNDPYRYPWGPHNNEQGDFIAAWRHVHSIFKQMGADNVIWMWSIHSAYENYQAFYPGDAFVDVVSTGILNFGTSVYWSKWWTFEELFAPHYQALANFGKPIIIVEFGSLKVGGDRDKWYGDALTAIPKLYKKVKGIVFFNYPSDNTLTDKSVTWELGPNQTVTHRIKSILKDWELNQYTFQK
jgi:beta-mannanase